MYFLMSYKTILYGTTHYHIDHMWIVLPSVYFLMIYKSSSFRINLSTLFTWKWFSPVCTLCCLIRLSRIEKTLITLITCEWLLSSVYFLMIHKSSSFRKNLSTLITWKWFLPSMYSLVSYKTKITSLRKRKENRSIQVVTVLLV